MCLFLLVQAQFFQKLIHLIQGTPYRLTECAQLSPSSQTCWELLHILECSLQLSDFVYFKTASLRINAKAHVLLLLKL